MKSTLISRYTYITNCGQTGQTGPSQNDCVVEYSGTTLDGLVTVGGGYQYFTIEDSATYSITVYGAKGVTYFDGGDGAMMTGESSLTAGQELKILVGQMGVNGDMGTTGNNGGGEEEELLLLSDNTPLIVAGGGGGATASTNVISIVVLNVSVARQTSNIGQGAGCGGSYNKVGAGWSTNGDGSLFERGIRTSNYNGDGGFGGGGGSDIIPVVVEAAIMVGTVVTIFPTSNTDGCDIMTTVEVVFIQCHQIFPEPASERRTWLRGHRKL